MDDEWEVYHELLQSQDNFDPAEGIMEEDNALMDAAAQVEAAARAEAAADAGAADAEAAAQEEAAVDAEAVAGADAEAIGTAGAEAAAARPRDPGAAELVSQGRLICAGGSSGSPEEDG